MKRNYFIAGLVMLVFFVISFLTNILGPVIPEIISGFGLNLTLAAVLPFSFFIAYGVMSVPAGMLVEKYKEKSVMLASFALAFAGALLFALLPRYGVAIVSLFLIGAGMAALQVAINPLLRVAGGEEHFAFNSVLAQLIFGAASFMSPHVYSYLTAHVGTGEGGIIVRALSAVTPRGLAWASLYWVFAAAAAAMVVIIALSKFPEVERKEDEKTGTWAVHAELLRDKTVLLFFAGIFCYVATEQGIANWISQFLKVYHNCDPQTAGASGVSWFWGLMTLGCLLGMLLLKFFDSRRILVAFAAAAFCCLTAALWGPAEVSKLAFPALGFALSVMWSIIFSLALNSVSKHHGAFSGILCTAIMGGAFYPLLIGWAGDRFGLRAGMSLLYLTLAYIFSIGIWAKPIILNETFARRRQKEQGA
ncbi:MAG: MFS transporter [Elusimicrobiales bacterium]